MTEPPIPDAEEGLTRAATALLDESFRPLSLRRAESLPERRTQASRCDHMASRHICCEGRAAGHARAQLRRQPVGACRTEFDPANVHTDDGPDYGVGLDGKTYPRYHDPKQPDHIRSLRQAGWTMREIAREIGCSLGTVHHVLDDTSQR